MFVNRLSKRLNLLLLFMTILLLISGCTNSLFSGSGKKQASTAKGSSHPNAVYYDFDDILVPREMKIDDSSTVVVSTPGYTSGIITLKGRIDKDSLLKFFNNNMQKDNWNIVSQIRSPAAIILIFQKSPRWAVITLRDREYYTYAEIGVAPSVGGATFSESEQSFPSDSGYSSSNSNSNAGAGAVIEKDSVKSENLFE